MVNDWKYLISSTNMRKENTHRHLDFSVVVERIARTKKRSIISVENMIMTQNQLNSNLFANHLTFDNEYNEMRP